MSKRAANNAKRPARKSARKVNPGKAAAQAAAGVKVTEIDGKKVGPVVAKQLAETKKAVAKADKPTDPKLVKLVREHAERNKERGWAKAVSMSEADLVKLLAGAKTPNAAIKRTRAAIGA